MRVLYQYIKYTQIYLLAKLIFVLLEMFIIEDILSVFIEPKDYWGTFYWIEFLEFIISGWGELFNFVYFVHIRIYKLVFPLPSILVMLLLVSFRLLLCKYLYHLFKNVHRLYLESPLRSYPSLGVLVYRKQSEFHRERHNLRVYTPLVLVLHASRTFFLQEWRTYAHAKHRLR